MKRVNGNRHWPATKRPWTMTECPTETVSALQSEGRIANFGIASKRPWVGCSLDWIGLMLHTPRLFFLSILSEKGFLFSSLDSDFQASWLLPWRTPTWLDRGEPVAWERDLLLIFLSYKNWFSHKYFYFRGLGPVCFWAFLLKICLV